MAKYKLIAGQFAHEGRTYKAGQIVSTEMNLQKMFPNSFEKLHIDRPQLTVADIRASKADDGETQQDSGPVTPVAKTVATPAGKNVTKNFASAVEQDFRVYKTKDKRYHVYDADNMDVDLSPHGLDRDAVEPYIAKCLEERQ